MDEAAWQFASWKSGTRSPELKRFRPDVKHYRRAGTECAGSHYGHAVGIEVETISIPRRHSRRTKDHRGFGNENVELDEFCPRSESPWISAQRLRAVPLITVVASVAIKRNSLKAFPAVMKKCTVSGDPFGPRPGIVIALVAVQSGLTT